MLKVGDRVIQRFSAKSKAESICIIKRVGKRDAWCGNIYHHHRVSDTPGGAKELEVAEKEVAEREAHKKQQAEAIRKIREAEAADPRTPFIRRFSSGTDNWDTLTYQQLQAIAFWLDDRKADKGEKSNGKRTEV